MSTNLQNDKLITKQVRLEIDMHHKLKLHAFQNDMKISDLLYLIVNNYFNNLNKQTNEEKTNSKKVQE